MDIPVTFGDWLKQRRKELDLTQAELSQRASCTVFALRKIEAGARRPSKELAILLAKQLQIPAEAETTFIGVSRGALCVERLFPPAQTPSRDSRPVNTMGPVLGNLPRELTPFIGREPELSGLSQLLADPHCALLTIAGPGGIGKTSLAIAAARRSQDLFPDGIWFVPLVSLNSPALIVPAIADALNYKFQDPTNLQAQLLRHLRAKRVLLVLDNAEHLLNSVDVFPEILKGCPEVKLLVTSRERLNLLSEWVFEIQGLPVPADDQVEHFESYSSVALFLQRARRVRAGFEIRERNRKWVRQICQTMGGMPLGIELSAAWVGLLSCKEIAQEIQCSFDFLSASLRDLPERHRSLRATLDHSWKLLHEEEGLVLSRLSVFRGNFSQEAAQAICGASLVVLSSLRNKCLLYRTDQAFYSLHEVIRQFAALKLAEQPDENEQVKDRHAAYYVQLLSNWETALQSSRQLDTFNEMACVIDNLSQAWRQLVTSCHPQSGSSNRLCADLLHSALFSLSLFYEMRCRSLEAIPLFQESIDYLKSVQPEFEGTEDYSQLTSVLGHITGYLGLHYYYIFQYEKSRDTLKEAICLLEDSQSRVEKAQVQVMLASNVASHDRIQDSVALLEESREVFREAGVKWWYALSTSHLAVDHMNLGNLQESEALFQEAFRLVEPGDLRSEVPLRIGMAFGLHLKGDNDRAEQLMQENLQLSYLFGNFRYTASTLLQLGRIALATQKIEQAIEYIQKSIDLLTEFGETPSLESHRLQLGRCFAAQSDFQAARDQFLQAIQISQPYKSLAPVNFGLMCIARTYLTEGDTEKALEIVLLLQHCATEYKRIEEERSQLLAELQAALPKEQVDAVMKRVEDRISPDRAGVDALAIAIELVTG